MEQLTAKEKAIEIYSFFKRNCVHKQAIEYSLFCVNLMISIERKYSNFGGVVYLMEVEEELRKL